MSRNGSSSVTLTMCLNNVSNWGLLQLFSKNASNWGLPQLVRKCLNNASNWGLPQLLSQNASTMFRTGALPQLLSENDKTIPQTAGHFLSYCQKMPQQCLELGPSSVILKKCLNNASNWGLPQFLSQNNSTMFWTAGTSSVTVRKCVNNASNWGLLQLLSKNV